MRVVGAIILFLFWSVTLVNASERNAANEQLLTTVTDLVNLSDDRAKPYELDCEFTVAGGTGEGRLTYKWVNNQLWSEEIKLGNFWQLRVFRKDWMYSNRTLPYTPLQISELSELLQITPPRSAWRVHKIKAAKKIHDRPAVCMELQSSRHGSYAAPIDLCIDSKTHEPLLTEMRVGVVRRSEYADYQTFREHRYPTRLSFFENDQLVVQIHGVTLHDAIFDASDIKPLPGAVARRYCEHMVGPVGLETPTPTNAPNGMTSIELTILPDGTVGDAYVIGNPGAKLDKSVLQAVKKWKFRPAMCGKEPVTSDIRIDWNLRWQ